MPAPDTPQSSKVEAPVATSTGKSSRPKAPLLPDSTKTSRVKVLAATKVSNPQDFVHIQALPGVAQKEGRVLARSRRIYRSSEPSRKQVFWENYHRRQEQFTQGHVTPTGKPYQELGEILYTDPKKLTLYSLGQLTQEPAKKDVRERPRKEVAKVPTNKYSFNPKSDPPESVKRLASFRETGKELRTLSKALAQSSEHLFRQLCAIHWLLEALTLESNSSMHSILTCWNPMDPGGCKKTVKEMEEEKLVAFMWELFVTNTKKDMRKARHCPLSRKTNKISTPVISQLSSQSSHGQTPHGSVNSLVLCSEDNVNVNGGLSDVMSESVQTKEQHHLFPSLQKLIQIPHGDVSKDVPEQEDMVEKTGLQRSQEERCSQKYQALKRLKHFRKDMERLRQLDVRAEREHVEDEIKWFPVLLARLPESVKNDHYVKKILKKLEKFGMTPDLKIHHDTFLKALTDLQVWELCSPEIAAAVEFVRESIVQMPEEDFSEWFRTRVAPLSARASTF
ncbi:coiled-coil domain-containing protein 60 isoform X3 [Cygnus atratus]|uniref:coiled-coil domain-containing protein 60 isoform X3 n=1 Tax=Cygnus atratus TaxID=8868 RepID=UPI0021B72D47|nr:coiled-coil domain-containing protein 60 isoform X3 [Cygnus atratus]